jgi:hypothetical protein
LQLPAAVNPRECEEESQEVKAAKTKERTQLIGNIFGSVKNKVIYWFENIDDQKLD